MMSHGQAAPLQARLGSAPWLLQVGADASREDSDALGARSASFEDRRGRAQRDCPSNRCCAVDSPAILCCGLSTYLHLSHLSRIRASACPCHPALGRFAGSRWRRARFIGRATPATRDREFEIRLAPRRVCCKPDFLDHGWRRRAAIAIAWMNARRAARRRFFGCPAFQTNNICRDA